jgi:trehalose synthase
VPPKSLLTPVRLRRLDLGRFETVLPKSEFTELMRQAEAARSFLRGRTVWNVNSTARGGGVAEMLVPLLGYARGAGVDARWLVLGGEPAFFAVTKRIHNRLHGARGDRRALGPEAKRAYQNITRAGGAELARRVRPDDVVILHDPQTAGMLPELARSGVRVVWRCHVGIDEPNLWVRSAIKFLLPYVRQADAVIFSRAAFAWEGLDLSRSWVIPPSIDAFSPKNEPLDNDTVLAILRHAGVVAGGGSGKAAFTRADGRRSEVRHRARMTQPAPLQASDRVVVQVSRWDALKDPTGVVSAFARHVAPKTDAHLLLAGPATGLVADDPEDVRVFADVRELCEGLPEPIRARVHLAELPMGDVEENAAIVNALQRHATIVVQKSLAEGFGLTVAEAMWKGRPVVASRIGGIEDQIVDGKTGLLVDPRRLDQFGRALVDLLQNPKRADTMGAEAARRVRELYLAPRHLIQYLALLQALLIVPTVGRARAARSSDGRS